MKGWKDPDLPKGGWQFVDIEDLGHPDEFCSMCGTEIRYVHLVQHPLVKNEYRVGCVCAGHMIGNVTLQQERERDFIKNRGWITTQKGNLRRRANGFTYVVYRKRRERGYRISRVEIGSDSFQSFDRDTRNKKTALLTAEQWMRNQ